MLTWSELAARTLARQFPADAASDDVAGLIGRVGPIQSQTARSVFLAAAARTPGATRAQVTEAYESFAIVRGSNLRGTVHTSTAAMHPLLEATTRIGQRNLWQRSLRLDERTLEDVWAGIEEFAADEWRTPAELAEHLHRWLAEHDPGAAPAFAGDSGRYFAFGHGGLIRRPLKGDWAGQGAPGYRTASTVIGDRTAVLAAPGAAVDALLARQLRAAGPLSRNDLAWWSGIGLTRVDAALDRLALTAEEGPDGRRYVDLADAPAPIDLRGVRLLPEFDALFCAFEPAARTRFVDAAHYEVLWKQQNGQLLAPVLVDDRLHGHWRLDGPAKRRSLTVTLYPSARRLRAGEFDEPVRALEAALGITVAQLVLA